MNVRAPRNGDVNDKKHREPDGTQAPFNYFAGTVILIFLVACGMVSTIRYWRWVARRKFGRVRGTKLPGYWEGYWGWE